MFNWRNTKMKKTLLALAITALSANAFAVNLDTPTSPGTQVFASEITVGTGVVLGSSTKLSTSTTAGFALNNSYARFELANGATFNAQVVAADLTSVAAGTSTAYIGTFTVASGGTAGSNFVIFNVGGAVLATDNLTLQTPVKVTSQSAVTVSYSLHQQASDAVNKTNNLSTKSGTLLQFAKAVQLVSTATTPSLIDAIGAASKLFKLDATTPIGLVNQQPVLNVTASIVNTPVTPAAITGVPASLLLLVASNSMTLNGNFSASLNDAGADLGAGAFVLAADKQSATKVIAGPVETASYFVNSTTAIAESPISVTYTPTALAGYTIPAITLSAINQLKNNGSTASASFVLKPGGAYENYVRVSNTGSVATLFTLTVTNDAGVATTINMSDVAGQSATALPAGGSSNQMSITGIYNAAVAKGFALSGEGKLRLAVTGATTSVALQNYVTSKDGNVLSATSITTNN
jgi:hypothetical protein